MTDIDYDELRRACRKRSHAQISFHLLQDPCLSLEAVGFLVRLLALDEEIPTDALSKKFGIGSERVNQVICELTSNGYMLPIKEEHDGVTVMSYNITDIPYLFSDPGKDEISRWASGEGGAQEPIALPSKGPKKKPFSIKLRRAVFAKTNGFCWYCGGAITLKTFQVDHIIPQSKAGSDELENLVPACKSCNSGKCDYSLEQFRRQRAVRQLAQSVKGLSPFETKLMWDSLSENVGELVEERAQTYLFWFEQNLECGARP